MNRVWNYEDFKEGAASFLVIFGLANAANIASNGFFHFNLNRYNSVDHLAIGVGIGSYAYKRAGGGIKGVAAGLIAGSLFNAAWETFEYRSHVWDKQEVMIDTISDIAMVYAGNILGIAGEKAKDCINRNKISREERWVL